MNHTQPSAQLSAFLLLTLLLTLGTGCRLVQTAVNAPGQAVRTVTPGFQNKDAVDPVDVQERLLRFADEFSVRMAVGVEKLHRGTNAPDPAEVLRIFKEVVPPEIRNQIPPDVLKEIEDFEKNRPPVPPPAAGGATNKK